MLRFGNLTNVWTLGASAIGAILLLGPAPTLAEQPAQHVVSQSRQGGKPSARQQERVGNQYFIEFRARYALSYGHTFLVHGRLNANGEVGQVTSEQVAGLHPAGDGPQLWSLGHVIAVPAETGASDGDTEDQYISARFRVVLNEQTYRRYAAHIRQKQRTPTMWHAVLYNCNTWIGEIANYMGLNAPSNNLLYPADFINTMRTMNSRKSPEMDTPSSPVRD